MLKPLSALAMGVAISVSAFAADSSVLFSYKGKDYALKDLQPELQEQYYTNLQEAFEKNNAILDQAILDIYIDRLAASSDRSITETQEELFKPGEVADAEVEELYNQFKDQIGRPLDEVKEPLRDRVASMKVREKVLGLIEQDKKDNNFQLKVKTPQSPSYTMDLTPYPSKGASNPKVTVVELADYRCGYCKKALEATKEIVKKYPDDVQVTYIDFPVVDTKSGITQAVMAGAYCARQQNRYWDYNYAAFDMQKNLGKDSPAKLAKQLKLDEKAFSSCMSDPASSKFVEDSAAFGKQYGVTGTPTFFVNGKRMHTHDPAKDLVKMVEDALKHS